MKDAPAPSDAVRRATVRRYLLLSGLDFFGDMCLTVTSVLLLAERGLTSTTIVSLIGTVWLLEALLEVPTGVFADAIGRRASLLLGFVIRAVGYSMLFFSASPGVAIAGTLLAAVGAPFASGSLDAWAVDKLHRDDPSANLDALFARGRMAENTGIVTGTVAGAVAGQFLGLAVPQLLAGAACLTGALFTMTLLKDPAPAPTEAPKGSVRRELTAASSTRCAAAAGRSAPTGCSPGCCSASPRCTSSGPCRACSGPFTSTRSPAARWWRWPRRAARASCCRSRCSKSSPAPCAAAPNCAGASC